MQKAHLPTPTHPDPHRRPRPATAAGRGLLSPAPSIPPHPTGTLPGVGGEGMQTCTPTHTYPEPRRRPRPATVDGRGLLSPAPSTSRGLCPPLWAPFFPRPPRPGPPRRPRPRRATAWGRGCGRLGGGRGQRRGVGWRARCRGWTRTRCGWEGDGRTRARPSASLQGAFLSHHSPHSARTLASAPLPP